MDKHVKLLSVNSNVTEVHVWVDDKLYGAGAVSKNINDMTSSDIDAAVNRIMENW